MFIIKYFVVWNCSRHGIDGIEVFTSPEEVEAWASLPEHQDYSFRIFHGREMKLVPVEVVKTFKLTPR